MFFRRWKAFLTDLAEKKIGIYAANAAFFLVLSLFPALMLLLALLSYTPVRQDTLLAAISTVTPDALYSLVTKLVNDLYSGSGAALVSITAVTATWSSSRGIYSLMEGFNGIYGLTDRRNYVFRRLLCLFYTVVLLAALLVTMVLYVFGHRIVLWLETQTIPVLRLLLYLARLRWVIVLVFLLLVFMVMYKVFPNRKLTFRSVLPGAVLGAVGWMGFTELFSLYVNHFGSGYTVIYGSLATAAIGMLWLYSCICILFFGAVLNRYLADDPKVIRGLFRK